MPDHASELSFDEFDELNDPRDEPTGFERVVSRRCFLGGAAALGAAGAFFGLGAFRPAHAAGMDALSFEPVAANSLDTVTVPPGFSWHSVIAWATRSGPGLSRSTTRRAVPAPARNGPSATTMTACPPSSWTAGPCSPSTTNM